MWMDHWDMSLNGDANCRRMPGMFIAHVHACMCVRTHTTIRFIKCLKSIVSFVCCIYVYVQYMYACKSGVIIVVCTGVVRRGSRLEWQSKGTLAAVDTISSLTAAILCLPPFVHINNSNFVQVWKGSTVLRKGGSRARVMIALSSQHSSLPVGRQAT